MLPEHLADRGHVDVDVLLHLEEVLADGVDLRGTAASTTDALVDFRTRAPTRQRSTSSGSPSSELDRGREPPDLCRNKSFAAPSC